MKNKTEKYVADAYTKMESAMKELGMKPEDSTWHNDTGSSLWSKEFDIQVFTPNSLVRDDDKEEYNTFVIWCDGTGNYRREGRYIGEVMGQTLLETIDLLKEELKKRNYDLNFPFGESNIIVNVREVDADKFSKIDEVRCSPNWMSQVYIDALGKTHPESFEGLVEIFFKDGNSQHGEGEFGVKECVEEYGFVFEIQTSK